MLVTPNNPTGAVYPRETIAAFAALCEARGIALILDETYRDFMPDDAGTPHDLFAAGMRGDTLIGLYTASRKPMRFRAIASVQ